ncbi:MAG: serine/threonine protein kinase [Gemmatimonadaceae bacterium]|nr:serine/threonine protein kinase [Gemmatimonadaceae bacterium]
MHDDLAAALASRYELERELGHGGMAIVYLARDVKHGRRVAVKVLRPDLGSSVGAERFLREIDVAAKLTHPNILTLHDSGSAPGGLLYYVMPFVDGETLRARLDREHQLPIDEALAITRQVGDALDYAHAHGVVHRDIKPENILLTGKHVLVADFGLARALYAASSRRLTESAVAVGTPAYMSPEQAAADPDVDARADVYSLACVLYEMVAGTPPFRGATAQAVLAQHLTATPPSICEQRPHCPKAVDAAVQRAMEKVPADRFRTAREFAEALEGKEEAVESPKPTTPARSPALLAALGLALVLVVAGVAVALGRVRTGSERTLDPGRYALLPLVTRAGDADTSLIADRLADALGEWDGVQIVRPPRPATAGGAGPAPMSTAVALSAAAELGAARAVIGETARHGDSVEVRVTLYDVASRNEVRHESATLAVAAGPSRMTLRRLANAMLRSGSELPWRDDADETRPSLPAWLAYDRGRRAIAGWDLATAAAEFRAAAEADPDNAQAQLWLAMVDMWAGRPSTAWRATARRAVELSAKLGSRDSLIAAAQLALAEDHFPDACDAYRRVTATDSTRVIGWFGVGECQSRDRAVLRDPSSPSGYRFRSSIQEAYRAYMHVVEDRTPPQPAFVYSRLADVLFTAGNRYRPGEAIDGSGARFAAYPSLEGDTLAFVPRPYADFLSGRGDVRPPRKAQAIEHDRAILRRLYAAWAESAPSSVDAHVALAGLLEATDELGGAGKVALSALQEIRRARALVADGEQARALARTEARLLVKSGRWDAAAKLVDSLFAATTRPADDTSAALLGPAALSGRIRLTAEILAAHGGSDAYSLTSPTGEPLALPAPMLQDAASSYAFAISGACVDALRGFPRRVDARLASYVADSVQRQNLHDALLRWPLRFAAPCLGAYSLLGVKSGGDRIVSMEQALALGDTARVRALYREVQGSRAHDRPGDVTIDYTYLESWLLVAVGDTSEAIDHLDLTLEATPTLGEYLLDLPSQSAALVRAMVLRAELAHARGDSATAARWGGVVSTLWAHADPELEPQLRRMRELAHASSRSD